MLSDGMAATLREYDRKLHKLQPNSRTRLEILKDLGTHLHRPSMLNEILSVKYVQLLREIWKNIAPDSGQTLLSSSNCGALKLQLHLVSLEIMDKLLEYDKDKFIGLDVIKTGELSHLFDLVDVRNKHVHCCLDDLGTNWSKEHTAKAYNVYHGSTFGVLRKSQSNQGTRYGELYKVVLTTEDGSMLLSELLATQGILTPLHFRSYDPDTASSTIITDYCRISHVISPGYVWVQWKEDWQILDRIQQELCRINLKPLSKGYSDERVIVRCSKSALTFRAKIMDGYSALGPDPALVLAIDFGWTCTVPKCDMYEAEEVLELGFEYNIACLCKLTDVKPSENNETRLLIGCLRVIFYLTSSPNWLKSAFMDPSHPKLLLSVLYNSHDLDTLRQVLYIFANAAADPGLGKSFLDPLTVQVGKFMKCPDLMRPVMQFYRTLVCKSPEIARKLALGRGMVLIMEIFSKHPEDEVIKEHFVVISKEIFSGVSLAAPEAIAQPANQAENFPAVSSAPRNLRPVYDRDEMPTFDYKFSQLDKMQDHSIVSGEKVSFVQHYDDAHYLDELAREISSMLNHKGGTIYVGVVPDTQNNDRKIRGEIRGLRMTKKTRDEFRLQVDDILTDYDILKRTLDGMQMIPESSLDTDFQKINNTFNANLKMDELMVAIITIKPLGNAGGLVKVNETQNRGRIDKCDYEWAYYGRNADGRTKFSNNDIRQRIAEQI